MPTGVVIVSEKKVCLVTIDYWKKRRLQVYYTPDCEEITPKNTDKLAHMSWICHTCPLA